MSNTVCFLQLKNAGDVVKQVLDHMTSSDNPSHIAVKKGYLHSLFLWLFSLWLFHNVSDCWHCTQEVDPDRYGSDLMEAMYDEIGNSFINFLAHCACLAGGPQKLIVNLFTTVQLCRQVSCLTILHVDKWTKRRWLPCWQDKTRVKHFPLTQKFYLTETKTKELQFCIIFYWVPGKMS